MNQLNSVILEGTLINDPEAVAKKVSTGEILVKFTIANDRYYEEDGKTKMESIFMVVQCWGELGERVLSVLHKGQEVRFCGRLTLERWQTKAGEKRFSTEIVCDHIEYRLTEKGKFEILEENDG